VRKKSGAKYVLTSSRLECRLKSLEIETTKGIWHDHPTAIALETCQNAGGSKVFF
jgi:hypothetical protein